MPDPKFTRAIECAGCGRIGSATWASDPMIRPGGVKPMFLGVSEGFYERIQKKNWIRSEVICGQCETVMGELR